MTAAGPLVSVNIPSYQQLPLACRALDSVRSQSYRPLEITIFDDAASEEYRQYVDALGDPGVHYHRNAQRLGAMRNMFGAIAGGSGEFTMAFHEDDLLSTTYVEAAVALLQRDSTCAFVACQLREFEDEPASAELARTYSPVDAETFRTARDLLRGILRGIEPMFGSIVYRRAALQGVTPDHDRYATLVDRPFLMSIMEAGWSCAVIRSPLVWYRRHGDGDTRHLAMTTAHVLNLLRTYRDKLPRDWTDADRTAFHTYTGYWLFELYRLTPPAQRPPVWRYLLRAWRDGVYNPRARGRLGLRQISRALLNQTS